MKLFSYFYRIIASVLIFSLSTSISALSIASVEQDSLAEILSEVGLEQIEPEIQHNSSEKNNNNKNSENNQNIKTSSSEISSVEVQRILETVIQKKKGEEGHEEENEEQIKIIKTEKTCVIPAKIPEEIAVEFAKAIENIPCELLKSLRKVEVFEDPKHIFPRAMANGRILKIRSDAISEPEFIKVLIHELGHVVDLGGLKSQNFSQVSPYKDGKKIIYADDKSVLFYEISWMNEADKKPEISDLDFVGGYASYDMFEDYAESFLMYLEHGNQFRILTQENAILQQKYEFFKTHVFNGKEFNTGESFDTLEPRPWDITKL